MTIESTLERIAVALEAIANAKTVPAAAPVTVAVPSVAPVAAPVVTQAAPAPAITVPVAVVETPAPVVVETTTDCPITTAKEMMDFLMTSFRSNPALGPKLQEILNGVGAAAVNELKPEQFAKVYAAVKAL